MSCDKPKYTDLSGSQLADSFALDDMTDLLDEARDNLVELGFRPYQVVMVRTQWSGSKRGLGQETVLLEKKILPVPKTTELSDLEDILKPIGRQEEGLVTVFGISQRYTQFELMGRDSTGAAIPDNESFYYEIVRYLPGGDAERRRFNLTGVPFLDAGKGWEIKLVRSTGDRTSAGNIR